MIRIKRMPKVECARWRARRRQLNRGIPYGHFFSVHQNPERRRWEMIQYKKEAKYISTGHLLDRPSRDMLGATDRKLSVDMYAVGEF